MTEDPRPTRSNAPGGPMSERMQALLSRAAEEQLTEQRQVSAVLADLQGLVANLGEQLRGTASSARLESLGGDVSSLFTELRMSTSELGARLDVFARRVDEQAASTIERVAAQGSGSEALAVRVSGLSQDLSAQSTALDRLADSLEALVSRIGGLATSDQVSRGTDSLVTAVTERLDRLEGLINRPALTQEGLDASLVPLLVRLDDVASGGQVTGRLGGLDDRLSALEARLGEMAERLSDVSDAAGGVPAVAIDLARMSGRLDEVTALRADVLATREAVLAQAGDSPVPGLVLGVAALREDVEQLVARLSEVAVPTADAVATAVSQQVTDRLVDELAPRVADLVLTRVAATLVEQVAGSVTASVQSGLTEKVRAATADSERRISAHVDEAVLALAEALLRRRRGTRSGTTALQGAGELEPTAPGDVAVLPEGVPPVDVRPDEAVAHSEALAEGAPVPEQAEDPASSRGVEDAAQLEAADEDERAEGSDALAAASAVADVDAEQDGGLGAAAADAAADVERDANDGHGGTPTQAPAGAALSVPRGPEPVAAPTQSVVPGQQGDDDEDEDDGQPRRPWWRPGG